MAPAMVSDVPTVWPSLGKRALELGRDPGVSLSEGGEHLMRLAKGRSLALELALADLQHTHAPGADRDHACILLRHAIGELARPPLFGGSRPTVVD
jgi:hypothetical protein